MVIIGGWLTAVVGVVFIGAVFEILLPHKRLKNSIKSCLVIIIIASLFVPIVALLTPNSLNSFEFDVDNVISQDEFYEEMIDNLENQVERKILSQLGVETTVEIEYTFTDKKFAFSNVDVFLHSGLDGHTAEEVIVVVQGIVDIGSEEVFVNEQ